MRLLLEASGLDASARPDPTRTIVISADGEALAEVFPSSEGARTVEGVRRRDEPAVCFSREGEVPCDFPASVLEKLAPAASFLVDSRPQTREWPFEGGPPTDAPVPRLPDPRAEEWDEEADPPVVDVARAGSWLVISVADGERTAAEVRVFVAAHPPSEGQDPLEHRLTGKVARLSDSALPDALVLEGPLPFAAEIRARPRVRLALVAQVGGETVPVEQMRYIGRRFAGDSLTLYYPPWLPERMDWFVPDLESHASGGGPGEASARISRERQRGAFRRRPAAFHTEGPIDLSAEEVRFLKRMAKKE